MKRIARIVILIAGGALLVGMLVLGLLSWTASKFVSEAGLVRMAEGEINSRVHIGEARLSVFRLPATITLKEVALAPRDGEVGKDLAKRTGLDLEKAPVRVKQVRLAVSLGALLRKRMQIKEFVFDEPHLAITLRENGEISLEELLKAPGGVKRANEAGRDGSGGKEDKEREVLNTRSLNVYAHGFLARLEDVRLQNAALDLIVEKTGMVIKVRDFTARLDQLDLDPAAIEKTNTARVKLRGRVEIDAVNQELRYAEIDLAGPAEANLFDPVTGDLDLELRGDFALGEETYLNAHVPVVQKAWQTLGKLEAIGLRIGELPEKATFGRSNSIAVHYHDKRFALLKPISLWFNDWEVALMEGTWIQTEKAEHRAEVEVMAGAKLSGKLRGEIGNGMDHLPKELRPILVEEVEATWFRDGRLLAALETKGDLTFPGVDLRNKFPDLKSLVRKAGEKLLGEDVSNLLKGLLGD